MPPVRADSANRVVAVNAALDLATARAVREAVLQMADGVRIDLHDARDIDDSAIFYLVTTLRLADRRFTIQGLSWLHARLLEYF